MSILPSAPTCFEFAFSGRKNETLRNSSNLMSGAALAGDDATQTIGPIMMRSVLAWSLLLLAASPFTAPYSTCDLGVLLGHATYAQMIPARPAGRIAAASADSDAYSVSPVVTRIELAREPALATAIFRIRALNRGRAPSVHSPRDVNLSPHEPSGQPITLRL
jgi:hypothetical protein